MKLTHAFKSNTKIFDEYVAHGDRNGILYFLKRGYKPDWKQTLAALPHTIEESLDLLIKNSGLSLNERVLSCWGVKEHYTYGLALLTEALQSGKENLVTDLISKNAINCNEGDAYRVHSRYALHPVTLLLEKDMDRQQRIIFLRHMAMNGLDKVSSGNKFLLMAIEKKLEEELGILIGAGLDPHGSNEFCLRYAATQGNFDMCRHLIECYGANIDLAITAAKIIPDLEALTYLQANREDLLILAPGIPEKPATIESLSREVRALRNSVSELTALVRELVTPDKKLSKPHLKPPGAQ